MGILLSHSSWILQCNSPFFKLLCCSFVWFLWLDYMFGFLHALLDIIFTNILALADFSVFVVNAASSLWYPICSLLCAAGPKREGTSKDRRSKQSVTCNSRTLSSSQNEALPEKYWLVRLEKRTSVASSQLYIHCEQLHPLYTHAQFFWAKRQWKSHSL